jgi:hypothetical protein
METCEHSFLSHEDCCTVFAELLHASQCFFPHFTAAGSEELWWIRKNCDFSFTISHPAESG